MLPIIGSSVPSTAALLQEALTAGFQRFGVHPKSVVAEGTSGGSIDRLAIDLTNANVSRETQLPKPGAIGETVAHSKSFVLTGNPLLIEGIPAEVDVCATDVSFALSPEGSDAMLVPNNARDGQVRVEITRTNLEKLLEKAASEAASKQGVEIRETHLDFTAKSDREMIFRADVVGKVFLMKAPVSLTGNLSIDDDLNLHLSGLAVGGSGMLANIANGFAQPHLKKLEAQPIALGVFALGALKLRDIRLQGGDSLKLQAKFGA